MAWSRKFKSCKSCDTILFKHKANGFCIKCYAVEKKIEKLMNCTTHELEIFRSKYISKTIIYDVKQLDLMVQKEKIKHVIEVRKLHYLKQYGMIETKGIEVDIPKLEFIFNEIARRIGKHEDYYTHKLSYFKTRFNEEQRKFIALKLLLMLI